MASAPQRFVAIGRCVVMAVQAGNGFVRSESARMGMVAAAVASLLRRVRAGLFAPGHNLPAGPHAAAEAADLIGQGERERILARARVHDLVAIEIGRLVQGNVDKREDLRRQLMGREDGNGLSAAWQRSRIEEVDRLISQQVATVDWHLREGRRLRQRIGNGRFPDAGPAARGRGSRSHFRAGSAS